MQYASHTKPNAAHIAAHLKYSHYRLGGGVGNTIINASWTQPAMDATQYHGHDDKG